MLLKPPGNRVCFVSARSGFDTGETGLVMDWSNGRLITELFSDQRYNWSLAIFSDPVRQKSYDYTIKPGKLYKLPFPMSYRGALMNSFAIARILRKIEAENDILIVQLPIVGFLPLLALKKPVVYHVCANVLTAAANPFKYRGFHKLLSMGFARGMNIVFRMLFRKKDNRVVVNGKELGTIFSRYQPIIVVSSGVYKSEIIPASEVKVRKTSDFRILFVGRPSKEKGINILLSAFNDLLVKGHAVSLAMIGTNQQELQDNLVDFEITKACLEKIDFYGFVSWGKNFEAIVRGCDCLVMCSMSEGTPRVIVEAMALGCPVIATNVGGVSTAIGADNGVLIPPGETAPLVAAIERLIADEAYRQRLARSAVDDVTKFTIEEFAVSIRSLIPVAS